MSYIDRAMGQIVGTRELKNRLSHYLRLVRDGLSLVVTDHGRPVARLEPLERPDDEQEARLVEAAAQGLLRLPLERRSFPRFKPTRLKGGVTLSDAVAEEREERT